MSNIITTSTPANDVATLLAAAGFGTIGTEIHVHREPDGDGVLDSIITVYDTSPWLPPEKNYNWEYPGVQVRVRRRAGNKETAKLFALRVVNSLHNYVGTVGAVKYHGIFAINQIPIDIGEDDRGRSRLTINLEIQRST